MRHRVLQEYVSARCLHSNDQHKTYWNYFEQNSLGQAQSPAYSRWAFRFVHVQMRLAFSAKCECGASEQTADHIILTCSIHRAPRGIMGLTVLDDETRCWLNSVTAST